MNYSQIIRRGWEILKNNKFLWGLGILAGLVSGGGGMPTFNMPANFKGVQPTGSPVVENPVTFLTNAAHTPITPAVVGLIIATILVGLIIFVVVLYFGTSARAGLILAVDKIETTGEKMGFKKALREGRKCFWRLLGVGLLYAAYVLVFMAICAALVGLGILLNNTVTTVTLVIIGVILLLAFFVSCLYLGLLYLFVPQIIVLENLGPVAALKKASLMVKTQWRDIIISWVIMIGLSFAVGIVLVFAVIIVMVIATLLGALAYFSSGVIGATVVGVIFAAICIIALLVARGIITAYFSTFTTLVYRALRYLQAQKTV